MPNELRQGCASGIQLANQASHVPRHTNRRRHAWRGQCLGTGPNPERVDVNVSGWPRGRQMLPAHPSSMTGGS
jgi:hypothetical protein